ncbi:SAM50-like protein [Escovopsis weberi]|uniref:SAM50-like protein n=1 Tax=Escovopsis weberi TaxID=150374 RepID=A0A0M8MQR5_ESCWE|nr:SAM50-like protein [Escovopsis weberi]
MAVTESQSVVSPRQAYNDKLHGDAQDVLTDAKRSAEFQTAEDEAKEQRIAQMMQDQMSMPMTVNEIQVNGARNIRRGFLDPVFRPLLHDGPDPPSTVGEVLSRLQEASARLSGLQILREPPQVYLSQSQQADPSTSPTDVDISLGLKELPRFKLQSGTDVGNGEGSAYGSLLWRNMFGGAEMLTLNAKAGTRTRSAYSANISAPVFSNPDYRVSLEALSSAVDKPWASHEEVVQGASAKFSWMSRQRDTHSVEYSGAWRQVTGLAANASPTIRGDAGDSVKSAIRHTFLRERRDNPQLPQSGYMLKTALEVAGIGPLGGDVAFSKSELELGGALPIPLPGIPGPTGMSIGAGLRAGMLWPLPLGYDLCGRALPSRLNDRFILGGPTDVRGFGHGGLGPRDGHDAAGGDVFAAGSVNVLLPFPYKGPDSALRLQLFANGGRLIALKNSGAREREAAAAAAAPGGAGMGPAAVRRAMFDAVGDLVNSPPSLAVGAGLVYAHPVARFELNFSLPMIIRGGEVGTKGLQLGVGINLL